MKSLKLKFGKGNYPANVEMYDSSMEVVSLLKKRSITDDSFDNMEDQEMYGSSTMDIVRNIKGEDSEDSWYGVRSYNEALSLLYNGWDGPVDKINKMLKKMSLTTENKRYTYFNDVEGFAPVVPLALLGMPQSMRNMYRRPIKNKVIDVMYNNELLCDRSSSDFLKASLEMLRTIIELEQSGYRINLWILQSYFGPTGYDDYDYDDDDDYQKGSSADVLVVKIKEASQLLDAKRVAFPIAHTAMFRVIGFDWYSRVPDGKYRSGYGGLTELEDLEDLVRKITRNNTTYIVRADDILTNLEDGKKDYTKELLLQSERNKKRKEKS